MSLFNAAGPEVSHRVAGVLSLLFGPGAEIQLRLSLGRQGPGVQISRLVLC